MSIILWSCGNPPAKAPSNKKLIGPFDERGKNSENVTNENSAATNLNFTGDEFLFSSTSSKVQQFEGQLLIWNKNVSGDLVSQMIDSTNAYNKDYSDFNIALGKKLEEFKSTQKPEIENLNALLVKNSLQGNGKIYSLEVERLGSWWFQQKEELTKLNSADSAVDSARIDAIFANYCEAKLWEFALSPSGFRTDYVLRPTPAGLCEGYYNKGGFFANESCGASIDGRSFQKCFVEYGIKKTKSYARAQFLKNGEISDLASFLQDVKTAEILSNQGTSSAKCSILRNWILQGTGKDLPSVISPCPELQGNTFNLKFLPPEGLVLDAVPESASPLKMLQNFERTAKPLPTLVPNLENFAFHPKALVSSEVGAGVVKSREVTAKILELFRKTSCESMLTSAHDIELNGRLLNATSTANYSCSRENFSDKLKQNILPIFMLEKSEISALLGESAQVSQDSLAQLNSILESLKVTREPFCRSEKIDVNAELNFQKRVDISRKQKVITSKLPGMSEFVFTKMRVEAEKSEENNFLFRVYLSKGDTGGELLFLTACANSKGQLSSFDNNVPAKCNIGGANVETNGSASVDRQKGKLSLWRKMSKKDFLASELEGNLPNLMEQAHFGETLLLEMFENEMSQGLRYLSGKAVFTVDEIGVNGERNSDNEIGQGAVSYLFAPDFEQRVLGLCSAKSAQDFLKL